LLVDFLPVDLFALDFFALDFWSLSSALRVLSLVRLRVLPGLWPLAESSDACRASSRSVTLPSSSSDTSGMTISRFFFLASMSFWTRSV
jgi:hypothetical protein